MTIWGTLETITNAIIYAILISPILASVFISLYFYDKYGRISGLVMISILLGVLMYEYRWFYQHLLICEADKDNIGPCIEPIFAFAVGWVIAVFLPLILTGTIHFWNYIRKIIWAPQKSLAKDS
jgi:hypothetical protein